MHNFHNILVLHYTIDITLFEIMNTRRTQSPRFLLLIRIDVPSVKMILNNIN